MYDDDVYSYRRLQLMGEVEYSLTQRSFHVTLLRGLSRVDLDKACVELHRTLSRAEALEAEKVLLNEVSSWGGTKAGPPTGCLEDLRCLLLYTW